MSDAGFAPTPGAARSYLQLTSFALGNDDDLYLGTMDWWLDEERDELVRTVLYDDPAELPGHRRITAREARAVVARRRSL